jgi:hypothetical protein
VGDHAAVFIVRAYLDILGREPTAAEVGFWGPHLMRGFPRDWVGGVLVTTSEFRLLAAGSLYWTLLERAPSAAEAKALADRFAAGTRLEEAWAELAGSEASWARHGRDPGAYVDSLYRHAFGRDPEPAGKAYWVDQLRKGYSRTTAALAFAFNPAASAHVVEVSYGRFLGRPSDPAGSAFWVAQLQAGMRLEYLLAFFAGSDEYHARVGASL